VLGYIEEGGIMLPRKIDIRVYSVINPGSNFNGEMCSFNNAVLIAKMLFGLLLMNWTEIGTKLSSGNRS
jgi:hypothetical protein